MAGFVHRGEVVFSAADAARHGGVGAVDALRRGGGLRGYAEGGVVGREAFTMPRSAPAGTFGSGGGGVSVVINNNTAATVSARETRDDRGQRRVEVVVDEAMATAAGRDGSRTRQALGRPRIAQR